MRSIPGSSAGRTRFARPLSRNILAVAFRTASLDQKNDEEHYKYGQCFSHNLRARAEIHARAD